MSSQTLPRPKRAAIKSTKRKRSTPRKAAAKPTGWIAWWPLLAGVAVSFATVKTAEILPLMGADGLLRLRLLYPFALLLKEPHFGLAEATQDSWSQIMLYAQFPLYGLYVSIASRWTSLWKALLQIAAVHLLAFAALWLLASR
jgi:hypothetical protein